MAALGLQLGLPLVAGQRLARPAPAPPAPAAAYTRATDWVVASNGMRWANKAGPLSQAAATTMGIAYVWLSPPWTVPAGPNYLLAYANHVNVEGDPDVNERALASAHTIERVSLSYADAGGTNRIATMASIGNGGVVGPSTPGGGVVAILTLPADLPANTPITIRTAYAFAAGAEMPGAYQARAARGEQIRTQSNGQSYAALVDSGGSMLALGGLGASVSGSLPGPVFACARGSDGRPAAYGDGDSNLYAKGGVDAVTNEVRAMGVADVGFYARTNAGQPTYTIPFLNAGIAGSGYARTDPTDATYIPGIHALRRALVRQVRDLNGGRWPFSHVVSEHYGNSEVTTGLAEQKRLIKTRDAWLRAEYGLPIIRTAACPKVLSTNGFRDGAGQTPGPFGNQRAAFAQELLATRLDGTVEFVLDTHTPMSLDDGADLLRMAVSPWETVFSRTSATLPGTGDVYLRDAPRIGTALSVAQPDGTYDVKVVITTTPQPEGDHKVNVATISLGTATWETPTAGASVREQYHTEANPEINNLHFSRIGHERIADYAGPWGHLDLKQKLRAAVGNPAW